MKIVFLVRSLNFGGAERQLVILAKSLDKTRFEPVVFSFYGGGPLEAELTQAGIPVISLGKHSRWDVFGFMIRLVRQVRKLRPDILHGYLPVPNFLAALMKLFYPSMRVIMGVRTSNKDLTRYDWTFHLSFWLEQLFAGLADRIIFNSQAGKDFYVKKGFQPDRIVVIQNGIDTAIYHPDAGRGKTLREEWGVTDEAILIGIIGRLDPMKGHAVFLQAAAAMDRPDLRFVVVGDGSQAYRQRLQDLARSLGLEPRMVWAASRSNAAQVYNAIDICCSASLFGEGFPNVVGEAMACGIPCVVTEVGDSACVAGEHNISVAPNDFQALAEGLARMARLTKKERESLGRQGRKRIEENYSVALMIRQTEEAFLALVEKKIK